MDSDEPWHSARDHDVGMAEARKLRQPLLPAQLRNTSLKGLAGLIFVILLFELLVARLGYWMGWW